MPNTNHAHAITHSTADRVVALHPGEGLWTAKRRWERQTGLRGLVVIR